MIDEDSAEPSREPAPKLEVTGSWFVFQSLKLPVAYVIFAVFIAAAWLFITIANRQTFPADRRFYGTWEVFIGSPGSARHTYTWILSPPDLSGPILQHEGDKGSIQWGVNGGKFYYGVGASPRGGGPVAYDIGEVEPDRIVMSRSRDNKPVELRRRK